MSITLFVANEEMLRTPISDGTDSYHCDCHAVYGNQYFGCQGCPGYDKVGGYNLHCSIYWTTMVRFTKKYNVEGAEEGYMPDERDDVTDLGPRVFCPYCTQCEGTGLIYELSREHEINMANDIFYQFASVLEIMCNEDGCGEIKVSQFDKIQRRIMAVLNSSKKINNMLTFETAIEHNFDGPDVVWFGRDEEYWEMRLKSMLEMIKVARQLTSRIVFC